MKIAIAQINVVVGGIAFNAGLILEKYEEACKASADIVIFPEYVLSGCYIRDLLDHRGFLEDIEGCIANLAACTANNHCAMLIGAPILQRHANGESIKNAAILIEKGRVIDVRYKYYLSNTVGFSELRHYTHNAPQKPVNFRGTEIGILLCEDVWYDDVASYNIQHGAKFLIILNASPFDVAKRQRRLEQIGKVATKFSIPIIYVNRIGADDGLVFDGGSFVISDCGEWILAPMYWDTTVCYVDAQQLVTDVDNANKETNLNIGTTLRLVEDNKLNSYFASYEFSDIEHVYQAIIWALRDYVSKNNFKAGVVLGLSGGIDSALVAVFAADALGPELVHCVALPSPFSTPSSLEDAQLLAEKMKSRFDVIPIDSIYFHVLKQLGMLFYDYVQDTAEENIQARIRGTLLMALSNKFKKLLLATGNKSELAVGYCTLYGDMCGGFAPIKDLYKTEVYNIVRWRNGTIPRGSKLQQLSVIPSTIIEKAPSAELKPNQKDEDYLPPYNILDNILYGLIERNMSSPEIAQHYGMSLQLVQKISALLNNAEFKRQQAPIGPKISTADLSLERIYPVTNHYRA